MDGKSPWRDRVVPLLLILLALAAASMIGVALYVILSAA